MQRKILATWLVVALIASLSVASVPVSAANPVPDGAHDPDVAQATRKANNGVYIVRITHKGTLRDATGAIADQWASLFASGIVPQAEPTLAIQRILQVNTNTVALLWPANVGRIYQVIHRDNVDSGT